MSRDAPAPATKRAPRRRRAQAWRALRLLALPLPLLAGELPSRWHSAAFTAVPDAVIAPEAAQAQGDLQGDEPLARYLVLRFMQGHPDLFWRLRGRGYLEQGDYARARECFERAASFADKPSQAMLGEMYWNGQGVAVDRALGYAWMDLAAERMYEDFLLLRERYWSQLDAVARDEALARGQPLLRRYGDDKARPRLAKAMKRMRPRGIDAAGFFGNLPILPSVDGQPGTITLRGSEYFDDTYWEPEAYFAWQDAAWGRRHAEATAPAPPPGE
ncbi:tetratricopeptide repeat protein [Pseudoxanthomonas suwonensis]|uniref:tetratricopeptide repeat protein n=1 Tax=Pseudoxanthomonas suwonensis TaxID=314722 RepID=UPI0004B4B2C7|nr:tetratricopeptide repeat protein [Pseudoxanthomonas suwonensis]